MSVLTNLDAPLLQLGGRDTFRVRMMYEHVLILGGSGSGKTSGSGQAFAKAQLLAGWGALVLCAKPDEAARWQRYARQTGRRSNVIMFDGSGRYKFNPISYMMAQSAEKGVAGNVAQLLTTILQAANGNSAPDTGGGAEFWQKAARELLTYAVSILWAATGDVSLDTIMQLLLTRPKNPAWSDTRPQQQGERTDNPITIAAWNWQQTSFMAQILERARARPVHPMPEPDYRAAFTYLTKVLANPDDRTTGNLIATLSADLSDLMQGKMRELFGTTTNVLPEMTHHGAVIIVALPLKEWDRAGLLAAQIWKYCFQRAAERRGDAGNPVFLWADEGQLFVSPYDAEFLSTARSSRAAVTYLSQNIPYFYERIGGRNPHDTADAFFGNFQTKIFHANNCHVTRNYAAEAVGKSLQIRRNWSENEGENDGETTGNGGGGSAGQGGQGSSSFNWNRGRNQGRSNGASCGVNEAIDFVLQPSHFVNLRTGGRQNRRQVDGVLVRSGQVWKGSGSHWLPLVFRQER